MQEFLVMQIVSQNVSSDKGSDKCACFRQSPGELGEPQHFF
jgi:hypothetical protein